MVNSRRREINKMSNSVVEIFSDIADAIRTKGETSDPISPRNMGNAIRAIKNVSAASLPAANLPAVLQDIADAIRACGITGTMTATQMASKIGDITIGGVPTKTIFYFSNGTSTESEITGELTSDKLVNLGLKSNYQTWTNCPTRVEIGSGVTRIGHNAFQNGDALTEVTMPDSVLTMGDRVFMDCDHLTTVTLSNNLTEIGKESFKWSAITGMTVPSSVTTIGSNVFSVCNRLNAITFQGKTTTQVQGMTNYNFGLKSGCVVTCSNGTITI
jgi:hypothetical protein